MTHKHRGPGPGDPSAGGKPDGANLPGQFNLEAVQRVLPQFIDSLTDAVLMVDRNRVIVAANRRYLEVFGGRHPNVIGSRCMETLNCPVPDPGGQGECDGCAVLNEKTPRRLMRTLPDRDGTPRRWEATLNPVFDPKGNVSHVVEVWRDISERSHLEGQLSHSERLASLGMLAAGVAHEINNPMASIMAGVESLKRWLTRTAAMPPEGRYEAEEVLDMLENATRRCSETTEKLLLLAQPYNVAPARIDLNDAARDTLSLLSYQMRHAGVTAASDLDPGLPLIWARDSGIRSVCMNLCLNAVQSMPQGGVLSLRTRAAGDGVALEVRDTGGGIDLAILDRIWDPFFTTKPAGQGTGLGLSITHRIVSRHGGSIAVDSVPGRGSTFTVVLPVNGPGGDGG